MTGKYWKESTKGFWLGWSLLGSPGYALPSKDLANRTKNFGLQFETLRKWMEYKKVNEHVIIAGLISIMYTILLLVSIRSSLAFLNTQTMIAVASFYILPFVGLAFLSFSYGWNYLLYHSHTSEFWIILILPLLILLSRDKVITISARFLLGFCLALPISHNIEKIFIKILKEEDSFISETESQSDLSSSRFSRAIEVIENDSTNHLDVLFFLPIGDMGDLLYELKCVLYLLIFREITFQKCKNLRQIKF